MLDEIEDAAHFLHRRLLPAHVIDVHPEVRVIGIDHRLADAGVDVERTQEQHEVGGEQEQDVNEVREARHDRARQGVEGGHRIE
ncbi:MAG: hypothetical protein ACREDY_19190, partial [Bradyrhizobium sp.]